MDISAAFLLLALVVMVGVFIAQPFTERYTRYITSQDREFSALMAEHERIISALQDLDLDQSLGKIPAGDYPTQRASLIKRGAAILERIDGYQAQGKVRDAEGRLEATSASDEDLEPMISARRNARKEGSGGV